MRLCLFSTVVVLSTASAAGTPVVRRCAAPHADEARARLTGLDHAVEKGDVAAMKAAWAALRKHACFKLAVLETTREPQLDEAEASRWWWDHGGREWLFSYLDTSRKDTIVPPDWPKTLRAEGEGAKHQAARLLCRAADASCGRETAGWVLRAAEALELPTRSEDEPWKAETALAKCDAATKKEKDAPARYRAWRECVEGVRPVTAMLPLARFDVPRDGWLVVRGRRGHYSFCDEVRAYDLATGAAYVAQSCSGLALMNDGRVNHAATDAARGLAVTVGRVPVDALREAAWMTFFAKDVQERVQTYAWYAPRPAGLEPAWRDDGTLHGIGMGSFWMSSAQTQLAWSWQGADGLRASGTVTWPSSSNPGETHATRLLRVAEAALVESCPPAKLPAQLVVGGKPGVSAIDATGESLATAEARLIEALMGSSLRGCEPPRP